LIWFTWYFIYIIASSTSNKWTYTKWIWYFLSTIPAIKNTIQWETLIHILTTKTDKSPSISWNRLLSCTIVASNLPNIHEGGTLMEFVTMEANFRGFFAWSGRAVVGKSYFDHLVWIMYYILFVGIFVWVEGLSFLWVEEYWFELFYFVLDGWFGSKSSSLTKFPKIYLGLKFFHWWKSPFSFGFL
jgi:hypothetical protein